MSKIISKEFKGNKIEFVWNGEIDVEVKTEGRIIDTFAVTPKEDNPDVEGDFKARVEEYMESLEIGESIIIK